MKYILLVPILLFLACSAGFAQQGYSVNIDFDNYENSKVILAHYYGQPLPTIYKVDSGLVDDKGRVELKTDMKIIGGMYLLILEDNRRYFEFILDNGSDLDIYVDANNMPFGVKFKKSEQNTDFTNYANYLSKVGKQHRELMGKLSVSKEKSDSLKLQQEISNISKEIIEKRQEYINNSSSDLLKNILNALQPVDIPDMYKKSDMAYRYYKDHYWDNIAFSDERLVYTPLLDGKLQEYFSKLVLQIPDSFNKDADIVLDKARASKEMFKYTLHWLSEYVENSKIMGMDASFVHLVEKYYMKGDAFWLNQGTLQKYIDKAQNIAPNVIGNVAPEMKMTGLDGKMYSLNKIPSKYTLLVFWSPDCGHCEEEIPRIDSVYKATGMKKKGVKIVGFNIDKEEAKWKKIINQNGLDEWLHVYDPEGTTRLRSLYDVYGTPSVYLLDEKKTIQGKKLDHSNIEQLVNFLEQQ